MRNNYPEGLASQLSICLRKELALARDSKVHPFEHHGVDDYTQWLQAALDRIAADGSSAGAVCEDWQQSRPRCARRALESMPPAYLTREPRR